MGTANETAGRPTRLGVLTPSSNTVLEPVLAGMTSGLAAISMHYSRFRVTEISLGARGLGQFDDEPMLVASDLLADARVASICWSGTSAGWLGFDRDRHLCAAIAARTGIPATSSVLALDRLLRKRGLRRIAFVTPYTDDVQERIFGTFKAEGYDCVAERHVGESVNFAFSEIVPARVAQMARLVGAARPEAIVVFCTNMRGAELAVELEAELGIPVLDTVATGLWGSMIAAGLNPSVVEGWGELFAW